MSGINLFSLYKTKNIVLLEHFYSKLYFRMKNITELEMMSRKLIQIPKIQ